MKKSAALYSDNSVAKVFDKWAQHVERNAPKCKEFKFKGENFGSSCGSFRFSAWLDSKSVKLQDILPSTLI